VPDRAAVGQTDGVRVRDWTGADHYAVLGVRPSATRDEIALAYRAQVRLLHPDTGPVDPDAAEQFVRVATAYEVLTGPQRDEYDRARRRGQVGRPQPSAGPGTRAAAPGRPAGAGHLSREGARRALWGGAALLVAGIVAAVVVTSLMVRDAHLRRNGNPAEATVVREGGEPRLVFETSDGEVIRTDVPDPKSGNLSAGDRIDIRYERADPTRLVTQHSSVGRDITLWIMALKFLVVGAVLMAVGARRLLRPDR